MYQNNGRRKCRAKGLLTPDNYAVASIAHLPPRPSGTSNFEYQSMINSVGALAEDTRIFDVRATLRTCVASPVIQVRALSVLLERQRDWARLDAYYATLDLRSAISGRTEAASNARTRWFTTRRQLTSWSTRSGKLPWLTASWGSNDRKSS
jgi:hypothetical protein